MLIVQNVFQDFFQNQINLYFSHHGQAISVACNLQATEHFFFLLYLF